MFLALMPYILGAVFLAVNAFFAVFIPDLLNIILSQIPSLLGNESAQVMQFTGFGAWIAEKLKFAECLQVIFMWLHIRLTIIWIPIIKAMVQ